MHMQDVDGVAYAEIWIMPDDKGVHQVQFFGERTDGTEWSLTEPMTAKICDSLATAAKFAHLGDDDDGFKLPKLIEFSFGSPTRPEMARAVLTNEDAEKLAVCMWKTAMSMCSDAWFILN